ncbi:FkbM family methyltransferase [bacterium]|nr:FkbM family methyltransferase [bacterium]
MYSIQHIKTYLKRFPAIVKAKRFFGNFFDSRHPIFRDSQYFKKIFSKSNPKNLNSLDLNEGLAQGEFDGIRYLLRLRPGDLIESNIFISGVWEEQTAKLLSLCLNNSKEIVVDIGANVGATSIPLAKKFPNTLFHTFEPHPTVFSDLKYNVSINRLTNVLTNNSAVSNSENTTLDFYAQKNCMNMGLSSTTQNHNIGEFDTIKVANIRLDDFFKTTKDRIRIIKIDTQGNELDVLESARETISKHKPVIFFELEDELFETEDKKINVRSRLADFFNENNYKAYASCGQIDFHPIVNFKHYYHGDILAIPTPDN